MILTTILTSAILIGTAKGVKEAYSKTQEIETINREIKQISTDRVSQLRVINDKLNTMTQDELSTMKELLKDYPNYTYIESTNSLLYDDGTDRAEVKLDGLMMETLNNGLEGTINNVIDQLTDTNN